VITFWFARAYLKAGNSAEEVSRSRSRREFVVGESQSERNKLAGEVEEKGGRRYPLSLGIEGKIGSDTTLSVNTVVRGDCNTEDRIGK
jgi:hypothetical protein